MDWFLFDNGLRHERVKLRVTSNVKFRQGIVHSLILSLLHKKSFVSRCNYTNIGLFTCREHVTRLHLIMATSYKRSEFPWIC